jgi:2-dehydro-3-deoxyphosphogluconate aldolase/(4S)-4-hydroxy-2-oxoglutarate aldolase
MLNHINYKLIAILRTKPGTSFENTLLAIKAAFESGIEAVEITSNSEHWQDVVKKCSSDNLFIGVGSIKNKELAKEAISCGAKFLVSPGLFEDVVEEAKENKIPILPGVFLSSEALKAKFLEIKDQKFFPANVKTHEEFFKAIRDPFRDEFDELEKKGFKITSFDSDRVYELGGKYEIVNSPTEFYNLYLSREKIQGYTIIVKLPPGKNGFEKISEGLDPEKKIRTYAVGGVNSKNMNEVVEKYGAYGVCLGGSVFDADAILKGDIDKVKENLLNFNRLVLE